METDGNNWYIPRLLVKKQKQAAHKKKKRKEINIKARFEAQLSKD